MMLIVAVKFCNTESNFVVVTENAYFLSVYKPMLMQITFPKTIL